MNLQAWREKKALSLRDLSKMSGASVVTITHIEHGKQKARPITKRKLAKALGLKPEEIDW